MFAPASPKVYQIKEYTTGEFLSVFQKFSENFRVAFGIQLSNKDETFFGKQLMAESS